MRFIRFIILLVLFFIHSFIVNSESMRWTNKQSVLNYMYDLMTEKKILFSQFDQYAPRVDSILNSNYTKHTSKGLYVYGVDFYYASGSYFSKSQISKNRKNLVSIVKNAWKKNRAIPCFSWHLENPYVPSSFQKNMGCRFMYKEKSYPPTHRYVVNEILNGKGDKCGFGNITGVDNKKVYDNPREWFEDRCKEVGKIINQFVDDDNQPIPFIFRLWHEQEDNWMWWGANSVSVSDYKDFYILTQNLILKYAPNAQIVWGFCPDRFWTDEDSYLTRYPGDNYVDILGFDDYSIGKSTDLQETINRCQVLSVLAKKRNKIPAIFETANKHKESSSDFFRKYLNPILQDKNVFIPFVQTWSTCKFSNKNQYEDRNWFLKQNYIVTF